MEHSITIFKLQMGHGHKNSSFDHFFLNFIKKLINPFHDFTQGNNATSR